MQQITLNRVIASCQTANFIPAKIVQMEQNNILIESCKESINKCIIIILQSYTEITFSKNTQYHTRYKNSNEKKQHTDLSK